MVETVVIQNANPTVEPTLEEQAAAAGIDVTKIDSSTTEQTAEPVKTPTTGPKILGKFNTQEELEKAYVELSKKLGAPKAEEATPEVEAAPKEEENTEANADTENKSEAEEVAKEAAEASGLDLNDLSKAYWDQGELTEEQYTSLEKAGYPKAIVDQFIAGQQAVLEAETLRAYNAAGGEQGYAAMIAWAKESLAEAEIAAYDKAVNSGDMNDVLSAVKGLRARYDNEAGFEPTVRVGGKAVTTGDVYESVAQLTADMANPLYQSDKAFRAKVEAKLGRSNIL